jgi:hypothetical protein
LALEPLFDRTSWGTPHAFGAAVILASLASELGIAPGAPLYARGQFDRRRAKELFFSVSGRSSDAVAAAARAAYKTLFGALPPRLDFDSWSVAPPWRK